MAAFHEFGGRKLNEEEWFYALGLPEVPSTLTNWLLWHSKFALMGRPPHVLPWHPSWPDYRVVFREIDSFFKDPKQRMLLVSNEPTAFSVALADNGERTRRLRCRPFLRNPPERYARLHGIFDLCLLELSETDMEDGGELTDRIVPLLKNGGRIILFVLNRREAGDRAEFGRAVTFQSTRFVRSSAIPTEIQFVPSNAARRLGRSGMSRFAPADEQRGVAYRAVDCDWRPGSHCYARSLATLTLGGQHDGSQGAATCRALSCVWLLTRRELRHCIRLGDPTSAGETRKAQAESCQRSATLCDQ